jgi:hypothetical protein
MLETDNWEGPTEFESLVTAMNMLYKATGKITWKVVGNDYVFYTKATEEEVGKVFGFKILSTEKNLVKIKLNNYTFNVVTNANIQSFDTGRQNSTGCRSFSNL